VLALVNPERTRQLSAYCTANEATADIIIRAEYMLEVIGAGATATTEFDWHTIWKKSQEIVLVEKEIENIHAEGRKKPAVVATIQSEFATSWFYQTWELIKRSYIAFWRNPTYLMAKLTLNIIGGLFIGFTFFRSPNSQQGTQNKIFVSV
jgi:ATP-binding cassette subfamily G (WHITE) protein 2 (SNQ2)